MSSVKSALNRLANIVADSDLSPPDFEAIVFRLSPSERRVFKCLTEFEQVSSGELRRLCSVSNISEIASRINSKIAALGDTRRVSCRRSSTQNEYGISSLQGFWSLGEAEHGLP